MSEQSSNPPIQGSVPFMRLIPWRGILISLFIALGIFVLFCFVSLIIAESECKNTGQEFVTHRYLWGYWFVVRSRLIHGFPVIAPAEMPVYYFAGEGVFEDWPCMGVGYRSTLSAEDMAQEAGAYLVSKKLTRVSERKGYNLRTDQNPVREIEYQGPGSSYSLLIYPEPDGGCTVDFHKAEPFP